LNDTEVIIEYKKFAVLADLENTYQYDSSHLYSAEGLISENQYGDQSKFRMNNEKDYGGDLNPKDVYFYHLWFTKDEFLIHITSKGSEDAKEYSMRMADKILSRFGIQDSN
jgi:hypothetical protein